MDFNHGSRTSVHMTCSRISVVRLSCLPGKKGLQLFDIQLSAPPHFVSERLLQALGDNSIREGLAPNVGGIRKAPQVLRDVNPAVSQAQACSNTQGLAMTQGKLHSCAFSERDPSLGGRGC